MSWDREKILNTIGFLLLGACFVYSMVNVYARRSRENDPSITTIRFAHWQLEAGIKGALDAVAAEYVKKHPGVRIEQILIPERTYSSWLTTRLVGGNPPELVALGIGITDERLARHFIPLTAEVEKPNPYNKGTELADLPWRDTFVDGLATAPGIINLFEYYGVPNSIGTTRLFFNRPLYEKIMGKSKPPETYDELKEVFAAVAEYNKKNRTNLVAIAGSKYNSPQLMDALFSSQTQRLMIRLDQERRLRFPGAPYMEYLNGNFDIRDPAILSALKLSREIGKNMPQGFLSLAREDAAFSFVQQSSLMIASGSWDASSLRQESEFEVGATRIPLPVKSDPDYGAYILGPASEAEVGGAVNFGLARDGQENATALDFLKYLTSKEGNRIFAEKSNWLPVVAGLEAPEDIKAFSPLAGGYPSGFVLRSTGSAEVGRIFENAFYRLVRDDGGVESFLEYFEPRYSDAMVADTQSSLRSGLRGFAQQDTTLSALRALSQRGDERAGEKADALQEVQETLESSYYQRRYTLKQFQDKRGGK